MKIPGLNIQWPWSEKILCGEKTIETRHYPLPQHYLNQPLALIETPGPFGKKRGIKASIRGIIFFNQCYLYKNFEHWRSEYDQHRVSPDDPQFAYHSGCVKYAWVIKKVITLNPPLPPPDRRGIVFTTNVQVPDFYLSSYFVSD
ncbi:MAG: hypothetical protein RMK80_09685 [Pseudobdellovibrionaceae bacterium]|nr:hypothetical protein [Pseudobdellovibrionaceae bacterium]